MSSQGLGSVVIGGDGVKNLTDLERTRREADNKRHSQNHMAGKRRKNKRQIAVELPVEEVDTSQMVVVPHTVECTEGQCDIYIDYTTQKGVLRRYFAGTGIAAAQSGDFVTNVVRENYGWYKTVDEKGATCIAASPFQVESLNRILLDGRWTDPREELVFLPLLVKLKQEFKNSRAEGPIQSSYMAALKNVTASCKNICDQAVPPYVRNWFSQICDNTEAVYRLQVMSSFAENNVANNMFLPRAISKHTSVKIRTGRVNRRTTVDIPRAKLEEVYTIKSKIKVKRGSTVKPLDTTFWFEEKPWPLEVMEVSDDLYCVGRATHQWCVLTDTVRYSPSSANMYGAISRIIKARDDEEVYQTNQSSMCTALVNHYWQNHLWNILNVGFVATTDYYGTVEAYITKDYPYLDSDLTADLNQDALRAVAKDAKHRYSDILTVMDYFHKLMKPTIQEYVVDMAHNTLNSCKVAAYTMFMHCQLPLLWRTQYAEEPHPKKLERLKMVAGTVLDGTGCLVSSVSVNVKDEIAKNGGKMPRAFVSYGAGVLCAPGLAVVFKERINGWHYFSIGDIELLIIVYAKPKSSELVKLFDALVNARQHKGNFLCVAIYSDDSCYSGVVNNIPFGYNVDISSCDSSNGPPIFFLVASLMSNIDAHFAALLVEQCCKPMRVQHPTDKNLAFDLILPTAFEGSGTVLTTCLNHVASILIAVATARKLSDSQPLLVSDIEKAVINGARMVGHKVTVASIEVDGVLEPSRFQFLKISPMLCKHTVTGEEKMLPVRNIGSIIKGFGQLSEDMQAMQLSLDNATFHRMTYQERFNCFLGAVVKGYKNEPSSPILTALRTRFASSIGVLKPTHVIVESDVDYSLWNVEANSLAARYTNMDYTALVQDLHDLQLGDNLQSNPCLQQVMHVDYEYDKPNVDISF